MLDPTLMTLQTALIGKWESPVMTLELFGHGENNVATGTVGASSGGHIVHFDYNVTSDGEKFFLSLFTSANGAMEYEITHWSSDDLTLVKKGYSTKTEFRKKSTPSSQ